jgi:glycerol kinase
MSQHRNDTMATVPGILAIDQGTTSSRAIVFDHRSRIIASAQQEFEQLFPADGWVEHNPEAIWQTTLATASEALNSAADRGVEVSCIGISNQRETTLVWDAVTGEPVYNAIVWQDRRTHDFCQDLEARGLGADIHARTGLLIDPYFSASNLAWILEHVEGARSRAARGELRFGTVDSFLIW